MNLCYFLKFSFFFFLIYRRVSLNVVHVKSFNFFPLFLYEAKSSKYFIYGIVKLN
ncbi:hypothetical protein GLYMA_09G283450v4 [Glycine max]|nr:hypothetical protein GLYMA_09G283450v4 [Glycine max]KAH1045251.1 hypothetical protein GYH30_026447 [Glycine max]